MRKQFVLGATPVWIAEQALSKPIALHGSHDWLDSILDSLARVLGVGVDHIHVVGSARFGFSLLDGTNFDPRFSDLDIAIESTVRYLGVEVDDALLLAEQTEA
nr:hypothetical protein [uncultured Pseudoxanthomonas sp.]